MPQGLLMLPRMSPKCSVVVVVVVVVALVVVSVVMWLVVLLRCILQPSDYAVFSRSFTSTTSSNILGANDQGLVGHTSISKRPMSWANIPLLARFYLSYVITPNCRKNRENMFYMCFNKLCQDQRTPANTGNATWLSGTQWEQNDMT